MKIDRFELGKRNYANVYLAKGENIDDYKTEIDNLSKKYIVAIFIPGSQPVVDTLKRILSDY